MPSQTKFKSAKSQNNLAYKQHPDTVEKSLPEVGTAVNDNSKDVKNRVQTQIKLMAKLELKSESKIRSRLQWRRIQV